MAEEAAGGAGTGAAACTPPPARTVLEDTTARHIDRVSAGLLATQGSGGGGSAALPVRGDGSSGTPICYRSQWLDLLVNNSGTKRCVEGCVRC